MGLVGWVGCCSIEYSASLLSGYLVSPLSSHFPLRLRRQLNGPPLYEGDRFRLLPLDRADSSAHATLH